MQTANRALSKPIFYPETWIELSNLSQSSGFGYKPTIAASEFVDDRHRQIAAAPGGGMGIPHLADLGVPGYLLHADALKLYEMAALGTGDILELGTHQGLSTSILAEALATRGNGLIEAVDIDIETNIVARRNLEGRAGAQTINFIVMDATKRLDELIAMNRKFGFIFVDHWHGYDVTFDAASRLHLLLKQGGYVLFHDALDPGNADPDHPYGVFQAITDTIRKDARFTFAGNFGCCSLYHFA